MADIGISIVVHQTELEMLASCFQSLKRAIDYCRSSPGFSSYTAMLSVIDNSEDENYHRILKSWFKSVEMGPGVSAKRIEIATNRGYGAANNNSFHVLQRCKYLLVMNPDVVLSEDALLEANNFLLSREDVVLISPRMHEDDGSYSHVVKHYPDCLSLFLRYIGNNWLQNKFRSRLAAYGRADLGDEVNDDVELVGGCFMLMRTEIFQMVGGFDERYFMYFEDFDLCIRLKKYGKIAFVPSVIIEHGGGDVRRKDLPHHRWFVHSAIQFFNRHGWKMI